MRDIPVEVRRLEEERELQLQLRERHQALSLAVDEDLGKLEQALADEAAAETELAALLEEGGASDEAGFRRREALHRRLLELDGGISVAERNLRTIVGRPDLGEVEALLAGSTREQLEAGRERSADLEAELAGQLASLHEERTEARVRRQELETNNSVADARAEEETLLAQIADRAEEWFRSAFARHLLDRAKGRFEESHQPRVIQEAGRFFARITDGRYQRVLAPHGADRIEVVDRDGMRVASEVLSRGTQEQLYLSIRFGYIAAREQEGARLPIIMDDVLVNFDPERARRAAEGIAEVARSNQVLFFTCHPHTVEVFRQVEPDVTVFTMEDRRIHRG